MFTVSTHFHEDHRRHAFIVNFKVGATTTKVYQSQYEYAAEGDARDFGESFVGDAIAAGLRLFGRMD